MNKTDKAKQVFPRRVGSVEDFARGESLLKPSCFDEVTICRMMNIREMADLNSVKPEEIDLMAGLLIASDRHNNADGSRFVPPPDIVFPAINAGSLSFLRIIPRTPVANSLDRCSGSGVAALALNDCSARVVASDITARATHFADFNRLLNRCNRVEVRQGDLYSGVEGERFDLIVAHPPYVPY